MQLLVNEGSLPTASALHCTVLIFWPEHNHQCRNAKSLRSVVL